MWLAIAKEQPVKKENNVKRETKINSWQYYCWDRIIFEIIIKIKINLKEREVKNNEFNWRSKTIITIIIKKFLKYDQITNPQSKENHDKRNDSLVEIKIRTLW